MNREQLIDHLNTTMMDMALDADKLMSEIVGVTGRSTDPVGQALINAVGDQAALTAKLTAFVGALTEYVLAMPE